jgi:hypothetical protein
MVCYEDLSFLGCYAVTEYTVPVFKDREDESTMILQNVGNHLTNDTVWHPQKM